MENKIHQTDGIPILFRKQEEIILIMFFDKFVMNSVQCGDGITENRSLFKIKQILDNVTSIHSFAMGKKKYSTQGRIAAKKSHPLQKKKPGSAQRKGFSTSHIGSSSRCRNHKIARNVYFALRDISSMGKQDNKKRLMSILNISSEKQIICSAMNIPSIENMLVSKNQLCELEHLDRNCSQSGVSFKESISFLLLESEPELMLTYMCLVQKALNKLGIALSCKQNKQLLMGVWNLLIKFWADECDEDQYPNLNAKIQWGLLQLLNFELKVGRKERIQMEAKIRSLSFLSD